MKVFSMLFSVGLILFLGHTIPIHAGTIYENTSTRLGKSYQSTNEFGDEVVLAGTSRTITNFQFYYFGTNFSGNEQARIRFYRTDGPVNSVGAMLPQTVLYDSGFFAISNTGSEAGIITLPRLKITVPDSFVWAVQFTGITGSEEGGLQLYTPPTIGNNYPDFWENNPASGWELRILTSGENADFGAKIEATQSPLDNTAPFISGIGDQAVAKNASLGPLPLTVGDLETDAADLVLSAETSDATLVPLGNVVFGGAGRDRTVTITPAANLAGAAAITISVTDPSGAVDSQSFTLRVSPPTISAVADQTIAEDQSTAAIPFTINDLETAVEILQLRATSSNTNLLGPGGILLGGSGASRTIRLTPPTNQFGTVTVTITVRDEIGATASSSFELQITPVNDLPSISEIEDQAAAGVRFPFTVDDVETPADNLTLTGTSSNPALVSNDQIIFGGTGTSRTVTINPTAGQSGSALIRITVIDGSGGTAFEEFNIDLQANTLPRITVIPDQTVESGQPTPSIPFIIGDAESPADTLTLSANSSDTVLIPTANVVFGGSGSNRTVVVTPAANHFGPAQITVIVTDPNGGIAAEIFQVTVVSTTQGPPQISIHPESQTRFQGEGVVFNVIASGAGPLTYHWRFNDTDLTGATNSVLTINNLTPAQAGSYSVRITNPFGSTISSNALLTVTSALQFTSAGFANNSFRLDLIGPLGRQLAIDASSDLLNWVAITTNTIGASGVFSDPASAGLSSRFYRARLLP